MKKIVDCFMFFNEKELLELRLKLLKDHVDEFVISELNYTHSGIKKEFICKKIIEELQFTDKKISVIEVDIDGVKLEPSVIDFENASEANSSKEVHSWTRERLQRDAILNFISTKKYDDDTVFIMGDCDEIINPKFINYFSSVCRKNPNNILKIPLVLLEGRADKRLFENNKHCEWKNSLLMCTARQLRNGGTPTKMRSNVLNEYSPIWVTENNNLLEDCGWHFTWMGNKERKKEKARSFIHYANLNCINTISSDSLKSISCDANLSHGFYLKDYPLQFLPKEIFSSPKVKEFLLPENEDKFSLRLLGEDKTSPQIFAKTVLDKGGNLTPIIIPDYLTKGTGTFNPSIYNDDGNLMAVIRHCQVTIYHSEKNIFEHEWGPLVYVHPENDWTLTTTNYLISFDENLNVKKVHKVDMSEFDEPPKWEFIGLEDCRLLRWNSKLYLCGVRRDTTTNGEGRMELSEIKIEENSVKEISRYRIPLPEGTYSYCEKNWMPLLDTPYHFVKWCTETEVVQTDLENKKTFRAAYKDNRHVGFEKDLRGSSQVLKWKNDMHFCIIHEVDLYNSEAGRKNGKYRHRFLFWDSDWNIISASPPFSFMGVEIEFCGGMAKKEKDYLISFGVQDNCAFVLTCPENIIEEIYHAGKF